MWISEFENYRCLFALTVSLLFGLSTPAAQSKPKPNVIIFITDDLGYGDLSCYGADRIETPNIDQLAAGGVRFTSGYCTASTCTPTRFSLLTGTAAFRQPGTNIAPPDSPALIQPGTPTIADMFRDAGYATAAIGKWHLGLGAPEEGPQWNGKLAPGPLEIGFDYCFLLPTTNDRVPQVYVENHHVLNLDPNDPIVVSKTKPHPDHPDGKTHRHTLKMDWSHGHNGTIHNGISRIWYYTGGEKARFRDEDLAEEWASRSHDWMKAQVEAEKPFFLYLATHDIHVPRIPHERFQGKSEMGYRGDALLEMDFSVGAMMASLKELGIEKETLVVFCSDNGPVMDDGYADEALEKLGDHKAGGPFKGGKYSVYEGGTRTPFITSWPGTIPGGVVSDEIVATHDLYASFAELVGEPLVEDAALDSLNVLPALMGENGAKGRESLIQQGNGKVVAFGYREGDWKLVRYDKGKAQNVIVERKLGLTNVPKLALYNLADDPGEAVNLAEKHPERLQAMAKRLQDKVDAGRTREP